MNAYREMIVRFEVANDAADARAYTQQLADVSKAYYWLSHLPTVTSIRFVEAAP